MFSTPNNPTPEQQKQPAPVSVTMFNELMAAPGLASLLVHPGFLKYHEYLQKMRAFYTAFLVYNSSTERQDMFVKGKINELDELINLPGLIHEKLSSKSEVV